jgi:hypothetical protein
MFVDNIDVPHGPSAISLLNAPYILPFERVQAGDRDWATRGKSNPRCVGELTNTAVVLEIAVYLRIASSLVDHPQGLDEARGDRHIAMGHSETVCFNCLSLFVGESKLGHE